VPLQQGFKALSEFARPHVFRQLRKAGAVSPWAPLAIGLSLPWLLGRGPSLGLVSQMNAIVLRSKPAIIDRHGTLSFAELDRNANRIARALARAGVGAGDVVALALRNGREFVEVALGAQKLGVVGCPLNTWARSPEIQAILGSIVPRVLVYDSRNTEQFKDALDPQTIPIVVGPGPRLPNSTSYESFVAGVSSLPGSPIARGGSGRLVIHTSGTTGTPKGAVRDSSAAGLGSLTNLLNVIPFRRDDVILCPAPLFHSFGLVTLTIATALGATLILPDEFEPESSLRLIDEHQATAASFIPIMLRRILALEAKTMTLHDHSRLRLVLVSGAPLSGDLRDAAGRTFGQVLYDLYGSTEAGWVTVANPADMQTHPGSVGKAVPGVKIAVFSSDGSRLPPPSTGEIFVHSDVLFAGYASGGSRAEREGFLSLGDVGHLDDDGRLYIEGRADDMVVVGGENVYPVEIEQVIETLTGVDEVAVLGVPDDEYGQVLVAFVAGSATAEEIRAHCAQALAGYKVPRLVEVVEELPRTSTGKVLKRELAAGLDKDDFAP
jgi:fatty-acyl-CoA synthase